MNENTTDESANATGDQRASDAAGAQHSGARTSNTQQPSILRDLRRSSSDHMVSGVAGGLASYLRIDPVIVRIGFVVLTFVGLAGLLLYGALWLLVPRDDAERSVLGESLGVDNELQLRTIGLVTAVVLAAAAVVGDTAWGVFWGVSWTAIPLLALYWFFFIRPKTTSTSTHASSPKTATTEPPQEHFMSPSEPTVVIPRPAAPPKSYAIVGITLSCVVLGVGIASLVGLLTGEGGRHPGMLFAIALSIIGAGLIVGAWRGDAGWLVPFGIVASLGLATTTAAMLMFTGPWGATSKQPTTIEELTSSYKHGVGEFTLDLSRLSPTELTGREIDVEMGVGATRIIVDADVPVEIDAKVRAGEILMFGERQSGTEQSDRFVSARTDEDRLTIDINQSIGQIEVSHP